MAQQHHGPAYANMSQPAPPLSRTVVASRESLLLLYVVDYCEKRNYKEAAAALRRDGHLTPDAKPPIDSRDGLLFEWWTCFWEVYTARVHPEKNYTRIAKIYSENLPYNRPVQHQHAGQPPNGRPGAPQPSNAGQPPTQPGLNGQPPSAASYSTNPSNVNGIQPPSGAVLGMPGTNPTLHNPNLQHLQQRIPGYPATAPGGIPVQNMYMQRPPPGMTLVQMGPMSQMQQQPRLVNGAYQPNPNFRPQPGQQSPQQQQDMQTAGASGSPKQPGATAQNSSPHNGQAFESAGMDSQQQGTPRIQANRGQKRPSPAEDDQYKDGSPPSHKKPRRSPQENGATLPNTPSLTPAQPPGNTRPPMSAGNYNGMAPNKTTPVMTPLSFPQQGPHGGGPNGPQLGPGMPSAMVVQLRELTHMRTQATNTHQTDQQYFAQMQQTAVNTYNIKPNPPTPNTTLAGPGVAEPSIRGPTNAPKGSMLPPPPPTSSTNQLAPSGTANGTPGKSTSVMSGLAPRNAGGNKDGSSPGGGALEGVSPESVRSGSRPIPGSTPQMTSAPIPGTASTPGGPTSMSAPSPSQMAATPQQISRPQTQSPSSAALARPSTAGSNGISSAAPNPSAMLARFSGSGPANGATGAAGGAANSTTSTAMGGASGMLGGSEPLSTDLFMSLGNNAPFDFQMMGYQEDDAFTGNMNFDFASTLGMDDNYNMSMYINEGGLDSVNGA